MNDSELIDITHEDAVMVLKSTGETVKLVISRGVCSEESPIGSSPPALEQKYGECGFMSLERCEETK